MPNQPPPNLVARPPARPRKPPFDLKDGDRVVLLGDSLIERESTHGYLETRLTSEFPDRNVTFRNLGWNGDSPLGQSRVSFDWSKSPEDWLAPLLKQIGTLKPTVVFLGYGMAASFEGDTGLASFKTNYNRLLDGIQALDTNTAVRFVLLSPIYHEELPAPLPDPAKHNQELVRYAEAIRDIAEQRGSEFINLFAWTRADTTAAKARTNSPSGRGLPLTDNGIHLNAYGYARVTLDLESGLRWRPNNWRFGLMSDNSLRQGGLGGEIIEHVRSDHHALVITRDDRLPSPAPPGDPDLGSKNRPQCYIQITGFKPGQYTLKIDGQPILTGSEAEWARFQVIAKGPQWDQAEQLRLAIVKKNEVFFQHWRPENTTYLSGFRQPEQGQNAKGIPRPDPLITEAEAKIAQLRQPVKHTFDVQLTAEPGAAPKP